MIFSKCKPAYLLVSFFRFNRYVCAYTVLTLHREAWPAGVGVCSYITNINFKQTIILKNKSRYHIGVLFSGKLNDITQLVTKSNQIL